ncbi:hypothetical protein BDV29DRAFT_182704 [Aspergillus leporis]|uniref:PPM-type phosphatase domain-containing protein n=1 Tax=Aspergillus leporis TaxID=41062 RepID=A0A5N5WLL1_9EURO|nr:hypothetical protein BDV29DRAFT_182704 [Aspergillus leporis]
MANFPSSMVNRCKIRGSSFRHLICPRSRSTRLRADEAIYQIPAMRIGRYARMTVPSNAVMEDAHAGAVFELSYGCMASFWGIYDGHM